MFIGKLSLRERAGPVKLSPRARLLCIPRAVSERTASRAIFGRHVGELGSIGLLGWVLEIFWRFLMACVFFMFVNVCRLSGFVDVEQLIVTVCTFARECM